MKKHSAEQQFKDFMDRAAFELPAIIKDNGRIHRFQVSSDSSGQNSGWYVLNTGSVAWGACGNWKTYVQQGWRENSTKSLTKSQRTELDNKIKLAQEECEKEHAKNQEDATQDAQLEWIQAEPADPDHPYLVAKGIQPHCAKQRGDMLVIPLYGEYENPESLQAITMKGKKFYPGAPIKGRYCDLGDFDQDLGDPIYICEGFATGASIHEAVGYPVAVAFNAGNLLPVAQFFRKEYPDRRIIMAADNDQWGDSNIGVAKASSAAHAIGAYMAVPRFKVVETKPTDFNDLAQLEGQDAVISQLNGASRPTFLIAHIPVPKGNKVQQNIFELIPDAELFHCDKRQPYVTVPSDSGEETWPLDSGNFYDCITHLYWKKHKSTLNQFDWDDTVDVLKAHAIHEGLCYPVFIRVASLNDTVYIDLCNERHEVAEIDARGASVVQVSPVKFIRTGAMHSLPTPHLDIRDEDVQTTIRPLWNILNIQDEGEQLLILVFILECYRYETNFVFLVLEGSKGSAKSGTQQTIKLLIDPSAVNLRGAPKNVEDMFVGAANNWVLSFNNLSRLSANQQDALCTISTGGGYTTRQFYTNDKEIAIDVKRPVMMNGLISPVTAEDLIDQCILIKLRKIPTSKRKTKKDLEAEFDKHVAQIFGGLLKLLSLVLHHLLTVKLKRLPRMADFTTLGVAAECALGLPEDSFKNAYKANQRAIKVGVLESNPVALAVEHYLDQNPGGYTGTVGGFLNALIRSNPNKSQDWPTTARGLGSSLRAIEPIVRTQGITIEFKGHQGKGRVVLINRRSRKS